MRRFALLLGLATAAQAGAQVVVTSPAPDKVAVTVYRDPGRGTRSFDLRWLSGYALISETRHITLPAGESEVRFEGVTSGIVPQSAIVTGLGEAVLEKNRDARLLSPGALLDANLGQRLLLRRTSKATGAVREQEAIVRATAQGVILQTEQGIETLRCNGLKETLLAHEVPQGLSAKPTLSVRIRSPQPMQREVTLSYITNNFDWQADYVGELSPDGRKLSLFAWMTIANGDDTGLTDAATQAVAGKLNRDYVWVSPGEAKPIAISCWPSGTTTDGLEEDDSGESLVVTGRRVPVARAAMAPPPPPPVAGERDSEDEVIAQEETLGDVRLYRIPIDVTVAARSQKQVALLRRPLVEVETLLRFRADAGLYTQTVPRVLVTRNDEKKGLGVPLPAGKLSLFGRQSGRRLLIGEGRIDDYTTGEKVEIEVLSETGVTAEQKEIPEAEGGGYVLRLSSDLATPQTVEVELPLGTRAIHGAQLVKRDGWMLWRVRLPANGSRELRYRG